MSNLPRSVVENSENSGYSLGLKSNGFDIWPIVRAHLHLQEVSTELLETRTRTPFNRIFRGMRLALELFRGSRSALKPRKKPILFIYQAEYSEYICEFKERFSASLHNITFVGVRNFNGTVKFEIEGEFRSYERELQARHSRLTFQFLIRRLIRPSKLRALPGLELGPSADYVDIFSNFYGSIYDDLAPGIVIQICYYSLDGFSVNLAAHRRKITTVDYQHGAQNDRHLMYTNWRMPPVEGYELLPDLFWTWGGASRGRIDRWAKKTAKHRAFVGGHSGVLMRGGDLVNRKRPRYSRKVMLIALQAERFFPVWLVDMLPKIADRYAIVVRPHPRSPVSEILAEKLGSVSVVSLEDASEVSKYLAIINCDILVTPFSSMGLEANAFGKPVIYVHQNAKSGLGQYVDDASIYVAENESKFLDALESCQKQQAQNINFIAGPGDIEIPEYLPLRDEI